MLRPISIKSSKLDLITYISGVYYQPFLVSSKGIPWFEANYFLFYSASNQLPGFRNNEDVRRKASILLEYREFCDDKNLSDIVGNSIELSIYDFTSLRPINRPTYRYFIYLRDVKGVNYRTLNMKTKLIYDFYKFLSEILSFPIDLEKVSKTSKEFYKYETSSGFRLKEYLRRDQAIYKYNDSLPLEPGFVRDDGEDLRPLRKKELEVLIEILMRDDMDIVQKLSFDIALSTGARKKTVFTLRLSHVNYMFNQLNDVCDHIRLKAGPSTGIDTKNNKPYVLFFPKATIIALHNYIQSKKYLNRLDRFKTKGNDVEKGMEYVFLSRNGKPLYMAKNDANYRRTKSKPSGTITAKWVANIIFLSEGKISPSFTFHWLRATFAKEYYNHLVISNRDHATGLSDSDIITAIQNRMNHSNRETTENYLKLFSDINDNYLVQRNYESYLFNKRVI